MERCSLPRILSDIALKNPEKTGSLGGIMPNIAHGRKKKKHTQKERRIHFSLHFSFVLLLAVGAVFGFLKIIVSYFFFLCLHEAVHAIVAKKLGYELAKIQLSASGAVLDGESDEFAFNDEILIAISAPIFNLCVAILLVAFWWIFPESYNFLQDEVVINLAIFAFNILPFFPLDGGRVLLGFLSKRVERKKALKICKTITFVFSCLLFVVFVFSLFSFPVFSLGIASVNLFLSALLENKNAVYRRLFLTERKIKKSKNGGIESQMIYVHQSVSVMKLARLVDARHFTIFFVVDDEFNVKKKIKENELAKLIECENSKQRR